MDWHGQCWLCLVAAGKQTRDGRFLDIVCLAAQTGDPITEIFRHTLDVFVLQASGRSSTVAVSVCSKEALNTSWQRHIKIKKGMFYIAQYLICWTTQSTLHFTPGRPVQSGTNSTCLGAETFWPCSNYVRRLLNRISTTIYSTIQLSELGRRGEYKNAQPLKTGDSNPGSLDCESSILPPSYRAPRS